MNIKKWFDARGPDYIRQRAGILLDRYGVLPDKAERRIETCVEELARYGCAPTFPTPGSVVRRYPGFIRRIQDRGAEIAVHSYDHIDLRTVSPEAGTRQLSRAASAFHKAGIVGYGFRCPYLSWSEELLDALPPGVFAYSSNEAIWWDGVGGEKTEETPVFETLAEFYRPKSSAQTVSVPHRREALVEIPVSVPDDLQYFDGLGLSPEQIGHVWIRILQQTHDRGELYNLIFHPELSTRCLEAYRMLLEEATQLKPAVWLAKLYEISEWWTEKAGFTAVFEPTGQGLHGSFRSSSRATLLARQIDGLEAISTPWDGTYRRFSQAEMDIPGDRLPVVGLPDGTPERWVHFLEEQGYLLCVGDRSRQCSVVLGKDFFDRGPTEVEVVRAVEASPGMLVKFGRWPSGAKSAFAISGDLDALSLLDYVSRLWIL